MLQKDSSDVNNSEDDEVHTQNTSDNEVSSDLNNSEDAEVHKQNTSDNEVSSDSADSDPVSSWDS